MRRLNMGGLAALSVAFGLGCSKTTVETPTPAANTGATVTTSTTATLDTSAAKKDSAVGYVASGTTAPATSTTVTTTTTTADTTHAATAQSGMPQASGTQPLQLEAQNGSGFTGNAVLTDRGDKTNVALTLNSPANTNASMDHNAAIRSGTCSAPGDKVAGLHDVEANGKASNTDVDFRIGQLADGQHVIVVNENPGDRAVACVAIPSR
jgi:hypothetical protein